MFNKIKDNETDFCESYKSEILGTKQIEQKSSFFSTVIKLVTILVLLVIIIGVSFYGYNYFINNHKLQNIQLPSISVQTLDEESILEDELVVEAEEPETVLNDDLVIKLDEEIIKEKNISPPTVVSLQVEEMDIDKIANDVKIAIAQSEIKEENETKFKEINITTKEENLEIPTSAPEAKYLEDLAILSQEIDKERNQ